MKLCGLVASILLLGATQARAQKADSISRPAASPSVGSTNGPVGPTDADTAVAIPRCWLGCRNSLQRKGPAEWAGTARSRMDTLESHLSRKHHPLAAAAVGASAAASGGAAATTAESNGDVSVKPASPAAAASEVETQRFLIEEWRRSELSIADSLHHAVLVRISRLFDSAQRATVSPDDRLRIDRQIDGINSINQMTWLQRRVAIYRQADSAIEAIPGTSSH